MAKELHFSYNLNSDIIMQAVNSKCHKEGNVAGAIEMCKSFLANDQWSNEKTTLAAYDILNGKARIVGTYPHDDYGIEYPDDCANNNFITDTVMRLKKELEAKEEQIRDLTQRYCFICENIPAYKQRELNKEYREVYDEPLFESMDDVSPAVSSMLSEFLEVKTSDIEEEYGWLEPNGTFHPVEWSNHVKWAHDYLEEKHPVDKEPELYWCEDNGIKTHIVDDEILIRKFHWVLLHSPYQGRAQISKDITTELTSKQKEFLYDYFIKRGRKQEAFALYED